MISIIFNKFIVALRDYKYAGRTPEALNERTCLTFFNFLINHTANLRWHIILSKIVENKGVGFTLQQVMDAVID